MTPSLELALSEIDNKNWGAADSILEQLIAIAPDSADAQYFCGFVKFKLGQSIAARVHLERSIELAPQFAPAHFYLSGAYAAAGEFSRAIELQERYVSMAPDDSAGWLRLGKLLSGQGLFARATEALQHANAIDPESSEIQFRLGVALFNLRRFREAIPFLDAVSLNGPHEVEALRLGTQAAEEAHRWLDACEKARKLSNLLPDDHEAAIAIARNLFLAGQESDAISAYRQYQERHARLCTPGTVLAARVVTTETWEILASRWVTLSLTTETYGDKVRIRPSLTRHDHARVITPEWLVLTRDSDLLLEQMVHNPETITRKSRHVRALAGDKCLLDLPSEQLEIDDACILVGGCDNYYHWLVDYLPRIGIASKVPALRDLKFLINAELAPFQRESLAMLGIGEDRLVLVPSDTVATCRVLWVPTLLTRTAVTHPYVTGWLRRSFLTKEMKQARKRRLLILDSPDYELGNGLDVFHCIEAHGFEVISPSGLSCGERVAAFATAEVVIAPPGPDLANIIFAPAGSLVIELAPVHDNSTFFGALTKRLSQTHVRAPCATSTTATSRGRKPALTAPASEIASIVNKALGLS